MDVSKTDRSSVVTKGTRFKFIRSNSESFLERKRYETFSSQEQNLDHPRDEVLIARGPLLGPLVIMASSSHINSTYKASIKFTVSKNDVSIVKPSQNEWVIKGWSKCSKECGEGKQHLIVR